MELVLDKIAEVLGKDWPSEPSSGQLDTLEELIDECNDRARGGDPIVADGVYDRLIELLREHRPESDLLNQIWSDPLGSDSAPSGHYTSIQNKHPMMSITTVKDWGSPVLRKFIRQFPDDSMSFHMSYKIDGHGVRVVYENGHLVSATSRARASAGRDLTRQMINILGEFNQDMADHAEEYGYSLAEVRGEICLKESLLEEARRFTPTLKSSFSAVASLIKPSSSAEENNLLDFLAYKYLTDEDGLTLFNYKTEEYDLLQQMGFQTPDYATVDVSGWADFLSNVQSSVEAFEADYHDFGYFCDGVVIEVDDRYEFDELGSEGSTNKGNLALKVNSWAQDLYTGVIGYIDWKAGKSKFTPVAVLEDGVLTSNGATVVNVPLYNPATILKLDAYPGRELSFRFGGEAGVVPTYPDGSLLTDEVIANSIED